MGLKVLKCNKVLHFCYKSVVVIVLITLIVASLEIIFITGMYGRYIVYLQFQASARDLETLWAMGRPLNHLVLWLLITS